MPGTRRTPHPVKLATLLAVALIVACNGGNDVANTESTPDAAQESAGRPDIVVVMVDDLRWDEMGAAGHPFLQTPNIDRVAAEGTMFLNAFATTPICSPSRAAFLTGQYVSTNGIIDNTDRSARSHEMATFPQALQQAGYETAFIGKWHMGNDHTPRPGFDYWAALPGQGEAIDPEINENGTLSRVEGYVTDLLTDRTIDFIEADREAPYFVLLAHKALHPNIRQLDDGSTAALSRSGFIPAPRHEGMYADAVVPRRPSAGVAPADKPALARQLGEMRPLGPDTGTPDRTVRQRSEMLMAVDDSLGRILDSLRARGRLDDTVVVFTSDHGYFYGEHGLGGERRLAYEESSRIPLLVRNPRIAPPASTRDELTQIIDLAPTFIELAGEIPDASLQGRSLLPVFAGDPAEWRDQIFIEYFSDTVFRRIRNMGYQAVRTERYKYIEFYELEGMDELYDLANDPYELENLIGDPASAEILSDMRARLETLRRETGAGDPGAS